MDQYLELWIVTTFGEAVQWSRPSSKIHWIVEVPQIPLLAGYLQVCSDRQILTFSQGAICLICTA